MAATVSAPEGATMEELLALLPQAKADMTSAQEAYDKAAASLFTLSVKADAAKTNYDRIVAAITSRASGA